MKQELGEPTIVVHGDVPDSMVAYGREKLLGVLGHSRSSSVLAAEIRLDHHGDPARERPNYVEMTVDLGGVVVRAHRHAETMTEAIDRSAERLRRRVEAATERPESLRRRHRDEQGWHHDDQPAERSHFYPRPIDERSVVRRKTFAMRSESIEDALFDLERLDHDFFLFVHDETGAEAVVYRVGDGYGLMERVPTPETVKQVEVPIELGPAPARTSVDAALTVLNETEAPFEFFVEETTGQAVVVYQRYDGNYGLITPVSEASP